MAAALVSQYGHPLTSAFIPQRPSGHPSVMHSLDAWLTHADSAALGDDRAPALHTAGQALILEHLQGLLCRGLGNSVLLGQPGDRRERVARAELASLYPGAQAIGDHAVGRLSRALVVCHMINAN
jgi:hypothetical protein